MDRVLVPPRPDWQAKAEASGFSFHTIDGKPYWNESAYYAFTLAEIERDIEDPTLALMEIAYDFVDAACSDEEILASLAIPKDWWASIRQSWLRPDRDLYCRMDFAYDGKSSAKLLEINADTPTALFEASYFQWVWLEEALAHNVIPKGSDQFNSIQEGLIAAFGQLLPPGQKRLHLASVADHAEDRGTIAYLADCASQAGLTTTILDIEEIGVDADGRLTDLEDRVIAALFKLYPWEFMIAEEFGHYLQTPLAPRIIEPCWKMILSNKGALPWLWRRHKGHPNLLPAWFEGDAKADPGPRHVIKPLLSREGANILLIDSALPGGRLETSGPYGTSKKIIQDYAPLPFWSDDKGREHHAVVGSWLIAGKPRGMGIREDDGPITSDGARFVPHVILG
jgi:glutathionylspermidine synthase